MPDTFGSSQELGGVYVKIGADLSGLQAGVAQAKALASSVQGIRSNVPLLSGPGQVGSGRMLTGPGQTSNSGVNTGDLLGSSGGYVALPPYSGVNTGSGPDFDFEGQVVSSTMGRQLALPGPGGGGGGYGGGLPPGSINIPNGPPGGSGNAVNWWQRLGPSAIRLGIGGQIAAVTARSLNIGADFMDYASAPFGFQRKEDARLKAKSDVEGFSILGVPLGELGSAAGRFSDHIGGPLAMARNAVAYFAGTQTDQQAKDFDDEMALVAKRQAITAGRISELQAVNSDAIPIGNSARLSNAVAGMDPSRATANLASMQASLNLENYKKTLTANTADSDEAIKQLTQAAFIASGVAESANLQFAARRPNELAAAAERRRVGNPDIGINGDTSAGFDISQSRLRQSGDYFGAQKAGVARGWDERIGVAMGEYSSMQDPHIRTLQAGKAQELGELDSDRKRSTEQQVTHFISEQNEARLRSNKRFYEADLQAFDDAARQKIDSLRGQDPSVIAAAQNDLGTQRSALLKNQAQSQLMTSVGYGNRINVANARGRGFDVLAGELGRIGSIEQEVNAPGISASDKRLAARAGMAELNADLASLTRPTRYATELNRGFEAAGGPSGRGGNEMKEVIAAINEFKQAMSSLLAN